MPTEPEYAIQSRDGVLIAASVQPGARVERVVGLHGAALKIKVTAPPAEGRANRALEALLANLLEVAPGRVSLVAGGASRRKRIKVSDVRLEEVFRKLDPVLSSRAHEPGQEAF